MDIFKSICMLCAGIASFLLGLKLMSGGLERGAGKKIKKMFARIGDNRFAGVGIGLGGTAVTQSSTATTVMVIGFVNAGVMTLFQATSIIIGANIGTTLTAYLGVMGDLPISSFFMAAGAVGIFMYMFSKNKKIVFAGEIITGLAIVFVGMFLMSDAYKTSDSLTNMFTKAFVTLAKTPSGPLLLLLLGIVFTAISQSSTVTTLMVVGMTIEKIIPVDAAIFIVMGANIGTTITALIASIGMSPNAKRTALIHFIFNLAGTIILLPIIWPLRTQVTNLLNSMFKGNYGLQVAFFHTFYNVTAAAALIGLIKYVDAFAVKIIPGKGETSDEPRLYFIGKKLLDISDAADKNTKKLRKKIASEKTGQAATDALENEAIERLTPVESILKETLNMATLARENIETSFKATLIPDDSQKSKIVATEQKINFINKGIGKYLALLSKEQFSAQDRKLLDSLNYVVADIERIGDHAIDFIEEAAEMMDNKIKFSQAGVKELEDYYLILSELFALSMEIFEKREASRLSEIVALKREIGETKQTLGLGHISRINANECSLEGGTHFYAIITGLERIADNLANIAFSVKSVSGAQLERLKQMSKEKAQKRSEKVKIYW